MVNHNDSKDSVSDIKARAEQARIRAEQAEARTEQCEARTAQCKTRIEQAETRTEQAETRAEQAKTRAEQAEMRAEQVEEVLQRVIQKDEGLGQGTSTALLKRIPGNAVNGQQAALEQLTERQREILRLIAEGQNTKSIADLLKVSPKTVEYHRMKLMAELNLHDIPSLVRYAIRVGLIAPES
jgi:DNA-binding NarL/FixJ family response regulator